MTAGPRRQPLNRREFLARTIQGLFVFFPIARLDAFQETQRSFAGANYPADLNACLKIGINGRVTCLTGKVEYGQGVVTSMAQLLAEELDVALDSVDVVMGDTAICPQDMGTFGSLSTRQFGPVPRAAGAAARSALLEMAAQRLGVPVARLHVKSGVVSDTQAPRRRITYARLVQGKRIERRIEDTPVAHAPLKKFSAFTIIGRSPRRKDGLEKVAGKAQYAGDIVLPGMLCARILRPPAHGVNLKNIDG